MSYVTCLNRFKFKEARKGCKCISKHVRHLDIPGGPLVTSMHCFLLQKERENSLRYGFPFVNNLGPLVYISGERLLLS